MHQNTSSALYPVPSSPEVPIFPVYAQHKTSGIVLYASLTSTNCQIRLNLPGKYVSTPVINKSCGCSSLFAGVTWGFSV